MNEIESGIIEEILLYRHHNRGLMTESTSINRELGIDGDDAVDLITRIEKRFSVKLASDDLDTYFGAEGSYFPLELIYDLFGRYRKCKSDLTISTLAQMVVDRQRTTYG